MDYGSSGGQSWSLQLRRLLFRSKSLGHIRQESRGVVCPRQSCIRIRLEFKATFPRLARSEASTSNLVRPPNRTAFRPRRSSSETTPWFRVFSGTTNCFGVGDSLEFARSLYVACASGMIFSLNLTSLGTNRLFWPNRMSAANFVLDPETSELFIAAMNYSGPPSPSSGQIDVLNLTTGQFDGNFSTRPYPGPMVFDPLNHLIYVANSLLGYLSVVDPRAHQTISSAQTVGAVGDMAVDQATGSILLPEIAYDAVEVYSPTAGTVVGSYGVGSRPTAVVYDNQSNRVYISESGGDNVTVLNGTTYGVVGAITVGLGPDALALDTADGYLFVNNGVSRTISVINLTTSVVSRTLPGQLSSEQSGDTLSDELTYDGLTGQVYATSAASQGISVIDARNLTVLRSSRMGASPEALCYDPTNERLFVADNGANLIEEYNGSTLQLEHTSELNATPYALLLDPNDHDLFVSEQTGVQSSTEPASNSSGTFPDLDKASEWRQTLQMASCTSQTIQTRTTA